MYIIMYLHLKQISFRAILTSMRLLFEQILETYVAENNRRPAEAGEPGLTFKYINEDMYLRMCCLTSETYILK